MGYAALLMLAAVVLTAPFAVWVRRHPARWQRPDRAIVRVFLAVFVVICALSALGGYLYPYGWPGNEIPGLRSSAQACRARYAEARTFADSTAVDSLILSSTRGVAVPSCGALRREDLPSCEPGSRCVQIKAALHLPE